MSKNRTDALIPQFLDMQAARRMNNTVYRNTGCFLFLTLPNEELLSPGPVMNGGDNYRYNVMNLYKMYHDYGRFFFWFTIQESQLPREEMLSDAKMSEKIDALWQEQSRVRDHYIFVTKTARHILAHGIFQRRLADKPYTDPKVLEIEKSFSALLSGRKWPQTEKDWEVINRWLVREANFVYDWLGRWADIWNACGAEKENLQKKFYYGKWEYSKNRDHYTLITDEPSLEKEYEGQSFWVYDERDQELTSFARVFSLQFVMDAKDYLAASAPSGARSQYEENGFWKSNNPESNLCNLYRNINFYGIENVRKQLQHPSGLTSVCPDVYRLYLEGLTNKMVTLPTMNSKSRSSDLFCRKSYI